MFRYVGQTPARRCAHLDARRPSVKDRHATANVCMGLNDCTSEAGGHLVQLTTGTAESRFQRCVLSDVNHVPGLVTALHD